ncbi:hypothetical protein GCM10027589_18480 [Actinocorallia lasiicapitis]
MDSTWTVPGYRHLRELGAGASGRVVMAEHVETGIQVAIKYLSPELTMSDEFVGRFREEARLLAALEDPNLVQFFEYIETGADAAIVMELINGVSLNQVLAEGGALSPEASLAILKGSLLGLAAAHSQGIVHRDYKPGNVLVDGEGNSMLADFGIAVQAGHEVQAAGTPAYMPPEQWSGEPVTPAADVYAATAVAYECMTGARPFQAKTLPELAIAHQSLPIPVENVPPEVRPLIAAGLAKDLAERPQRADQLLWELETIAGSVYGEEWEERGRSHLKERALALLLLFPLGAGVGVTASDIATSVLPAQPPAAPAVMRAAAQAAKLKFGLLIAAGAAVLALLVGGAFVFVDSSDSKAVPQAAPAGEEDPNANGGGDTPAPTPSGSQTPEGSDAKDPVATTTPSTPASPSKSPSPSTSPSDDGDDGMDPADPDDQDPDPKPSETKPPEPTPPPVAPTPPPVDPEPEPEPPAPTEEPKEPLTVTALRASAGIRGSSLVITVAGAIAGEEGSITVVVTGLHNGASEGTRTLTLTAAGPFNRSFVFAGVFSPGGCDIGSATVTAGGQSASAGPVKGDCIR